MPFRIAASVLAASSIYLAGLAITIGLPHQADEFDIVGFRQKLQIFLTRICYGFWRLCLGVRVTTKGKPVSKKEAQVIVLGPHSTVYDTMIADQVRISFQGSKLRNSNSSFLRIISCFRSLRVHFRGPLWEVHMETTFATECFARLVQSLSTEQIARQLQTLLA